MLFDMIPAQTLVLALALASALSTYDALLDESKGRIRMLLHRYNELLNLPYVHERVEGLWRIIEALGDSVPLTPQAQAKKAACPPGIYRPPTIAMPLKVRSCIAGPCTYLQQIHFHLTLPS
jgi:hypothetical protein